MRELLPLHLKIEVDQVSRQVAKNAARFLVGVVGRPMRMDCQVDIGDLYEGNGTDVGVLPKAALARFILDTYCG